MIATWAVPFMLGSVNSEMEKFTVKFIFPVFLNAQKGKSNCENYRLRLPYN